MRFARSAIDFRLHVFASSRLHVFASSRLRVFASSRLRGETCFSCDRRTAAKVGAWFHVPIPNQRIILTAWSRLESHPTTHPRTRVLFSDHAVHYKFSVRVSHASRTHPRADRPPLPVAHIARDPAHRRAPAIRFGIAALDRHLPAGGLTIGALHEAAGTGPDTEHDAVAALFAAGALARLRGPVLWALTRDDLFAPALAGRRAAPRPADPGQRGQAGPVGDGGRAAPSRPGRGGR